MCGRIPHSSHHHPNLRGNCFDYRRICHYYEVYCGIVADMVDVDSAVASRVGLAEWAAIAAAAVVFVVDILPFLRLHWNCSDSHTNGSLSLRSIRLFSISYSMYALTTIEMHSAIWHQNSHRPMTCYRLVAAHFFMEKIKIQLNPNKNQMKTHVRCSVPFSRRIQMTFAGRSLTHSDWHKRPSRTSGNMRCQWLLLWSFVCCASSSFIDNSKENYRRIPIQTKIEKVNFLIYSIWSGQVNDRNHEFGNKGKFHSNESYGANEEFG